jgi:thiamine-phosphate pyrophosphorylase
MMRGLYLITDETLTPYDDIEHYLTPALQNGAKIIQLRDKTGDDETLLQTALKIKALCREYEATFIINDRVDLAREVDADGLHIGRDDESFELARRMMGKKKIIGVSCYGDIFRAKELEHRGVDYVAFGSFFPSATKPHAPTISLSVLADAKRMLNVPVCAIGGITSENAPALVQNGADMIAVISDLWLSDDIAARCRIYAELFNNAASPL